MLPRDLYPLFRTQESDFTSTVTSYVRILASNPDRVGVIFSNMTATSFFIRTLPGTFPTDKGFHMHLEGDFKEFYHHENGYLTQCEWYIGGVVGAQVHIIELILDPPSSRIQLAQ